VIKADDLRNLVIRPTLERFNELLDKPIRLDDSVVELLLGTACHESLCGYYLKQVKGPALSIFQVEPATHDSIWENYLHYRQNVRESVHAFTSKLYPDPTEMIWNLAYATIMARLVYLPVPEPIPDDLEGWATYWDTHYNKNPHKGTPAEFIQNYRTYAK